VLTQTCNPFSYCNLFAVSAGVAWQGELLLGCAAVVQPTMQLAASVNVCSHQRIDTCSKAELSSTNQTMPALAACTGYWAGIPFVYGVVGRHHVAAPFAPAMCAPDPFAYITWYSETCTLWLGSHIVIHVAITYLPRSVKGHHCGVPQADHASAGGAST
jgi:hypothetical protein